MVRSLLQRRRAHIRRIHPGRGLHRPGTAAGRCPFRCGQHPLFRLHHGRLSQQCALRQRSHAEHLQPCSAKSSGRQLFQRPSCGSAAQWEFQKDSNLRLVYGRGLARPNVGDLVPVTTKDQNQTPYPTVATGNPKLVPTKSDDFDILVEHYFQPLGILQAGYFYKRLTDPIYPIANLIYFDGNSPCTSGSSTSCRQWQLAQSINGPDAHIQGVEAQWEQRFSFLPGLLSGFGINANYSHATSQVTFPSGFDGARTDKPSLDRTSPNDYNFNLTYDKYRFSGRFAISHNDESIASYGWNAATGPANDPILGLKGPLGDNYFYPHTQFDVQGSFRLYKGVQVIASGLNLSNEVFGFYNGSPIYPVQREYYRPTLSFGLRWSASSEQ